MNEMDDALFESKFQDVLLLAGESEFTSQFTEGLQRILNETEEALDMAMEPEEIEAISLCLPLLRELLEKQEKFLLASREKLLAEMFPEEKPEQEAIN